MKGLNLTGTVAQWVGFIIALFLFVFFLGFIMDALRDIRDTLQNGNGNGNGV